MRGAGCFGTPGCRPRLIAFDCLFGTPNSLDLFRSTRTSSSPIRSTAASSQSASSHFKKMERISTDAASVAFITDIKAFKVPSVKGHRFRFAYDAKLRSPPRSQRGLPAHVNKWEANACRQNHTVCSRKSSRVGSTDLEIYEIPSLYCLIVSHTIDLGSRNRKDIERKPLICHLGCTA